MKRIYASQDHDAEYSKFLLKKYDGYYDKFLNIRENVEIFHYTSPSGFLSVLETETLRFTDREYLNDYSESTYAINLFIEVVRQLNIDKEFSDYFTNKCERELRNQQSFRHYQCSFSCNPDSLCLWNYYTKGDSIKGYNLGFESMALVEALSPTLDSEKESTPYVLHGKVIYNSEEQKVIVKEIILDFFSEYEISENPLRLIITNEILFPLLYGIGISLNMTIFKSKMSIKS